MNSGESAILMLMTHTVTRLAFGLLLCLLVGCDFAAQERVKLLLPSVAETETAKNAVDLIANVMTNAGFSQTIASKYSDSTIIDSFEGSGRLICVVYHRSGHVEIVMDEFGRIKSRPEVIKARDDLKRILSEKFGKENVSEEE